MHLFKYENIFNEVKLACNIQILKLFFLEVVHGVYLIFQSRPGLILVPNHFCKHMHYHKQKTCYCDWTNLNPGGRGSNNTPLLATQQPIIELSAYSHE